MKTVEEARRRFMTQQLAAMTPAERLARFAILQAEAMNRLRKAPGAYERILRRNIRARAVPHPGHGITAG